MNVSPSDPHLSNRYFDPTKNKQGGPECNVGPPSIIIVPSISSASRFGTQRKEDEDEVHKKTLSPISATDDEKRWLSRVDKRAKALKALPKFPQREQSFVDRTSSIEHHGDEEELATSHSIFSDCEKLSDEVAKIPREIESERWESSCGSRKCNSIRTRTLNDSVQSLTVPTRRPSPKRREKGWSSYSDGCGIPLTSKIEASLHYIPQKPRRQKSDL